jgi:hypothetical protein
VEAAKKKMVDLLQTHLLGHIGPGHEAINTKKTLQCLETLQTLFANALAEHPDPRHLSVRTTNARLRKLVFDVPGGEQLMLNARWRPEVKEYERVLVYNPDSPLDKAVMQVCHAQLEKYITKVRDSVTRYERNLTETHADEERRRQRTLELLAEDRESRKNGSFRSSA